jgi:hypothetical protein
LSVWRFLVDLLACAQEVKHFGRTSRTFMSHVDISAVLVLNIAALGTDDVLIGTGDLA